MGMTRTRLVLCLWLSACQPGLGRALLKSGNFSSHALDYIDYSEDSVKPLRPTSWDITSDALDIASLLAEDDMADKSAPLRYAMRKNVTVDIVQDGRREDSLTRNGTTFRIDVSSPNALHTTLLFDQFELAPGVEVLIHSDWSSLGPFTEADNRGSFVTAPIAGSRVTITCFVPDTVTASDVELHLQSVYLGYRPISTSTRTQGEYGESGPCNVDVDCELGAEWGAQRKAVVQILVNGHHGSALCTGALVNNAAQDRRPLLLTAAHCLGGNTAAWGFLFNYEAEGCGGSESGPFDDFLQGCSVLASDDATDFALVELSQRVPAQFDAYFAGWDARDQAAPGSIGIHHPRGDVKKISMNDDLLTSSSWGSTPDTHWRVGDWEIGTTEPGSSGSPLFHPQDRRIIGHLTGGSAACPAMTGYDVYGKTARAFSVGLAQYLAGDSGLSVLDGIWDGIRPPAPSAFPSPPPSPPSPPLQPSPAAPIDCVVSSWSAWSECDAYCTDAASANHTKPQKLHASAALTGEVLEVVKGASVQGRHALSSTGEATLAASADGRLPPIHGWYTSDHALMAHGDANRWILKLRGDNRTRASELCTELGDVAAKCLKPPGFSARFVPVAVTSAEQLLQLRSELAAELEYIERDGVVQAFQSDLLTSPQPNPPSWGLDRVDQDALPLDELYDARGLNGSGVHVFVIDTGINAAHVDFAGRVGASYNAITDQPSAPDGNGHGTHCSGTVMGTSYGVAKGATLHGVKVLSDSGSGTFADVIEGMEWVASRPERPAVASMSLGGGQSQAINDAVATMHGAGVTVVAAAGNNNGDACGNSPASAPEAITVGSTTSSDARSSFSNWGTCVDIFAPGSDITSAWVGSSTASRTISGTSMATPHVAGAAALYLESEPSASPAAVTAALVAAAAERVVDSRTPHGKLLQVQDLSACDTPGQCLSEWSAWSACPDAATACGEHFRTRARTVLPDCGEQPCGHLQEREPCPMEYPACPQPAPTQQFGSGFDLGGRALTFTPNGDGAYTTCIEEEEGAEGLRDPPSPDATAVQLGDDASRAIAISPAFTFFGTEHDRLYVGSNGYITFGSGDATYRGSLSAHFSKPRISALFDDLDPSTGGEVVYEVVAEGTADARVVVTWVNVPEYGASTGNTFQVALHLGNA
ncbi:hypothetical protein CYMTET_14499 [Cymbomonas tetramitiformis]|uniref:Subtilisin n=1 Tax=Cymbomonas tetramitiformis TaxID=36881 RepID=A0AAE0GGC4_9CHLO|nr:hypothetical protein CYMTET_14499 [Cymbomonas tetramitiformis]